MKKILLVITTLALACGLMLGSVGSVFAQDGPQNNPECRGLFGKVESVDIGGDGGGVIGLKDAEPLTVTENTTYHIPAFVPPWQTWAELSDEGKQCVQNATRIAVLLAKPATERIALKVMVIPQRPVHAHRVGVVISIEDNTITIVITHINDPPVGNAVRLRCSVRKTRILSKPAACIYARAIGIEVVLAAAR